MLLSHYHNHYTSLFKASKPTEIEPDELLPRLMVAYIILLR